MQEPRYFPSPERATADGVVAIGGHLKPDWLIDAYTHGIFPWPVRTDDGHELRLWFSPDPRAIFELDGFHTSRRLLQKLRSGRFTVTFDRDFAGVIRGCAEARRDGHGTWITPSMIAGYTRLAELGIAHSVEVWQQGELVGGTYGLAIRGFYAGESMFYRATDASKIALCFLFVHLRSRGYKLFDTQQRTPHTARLGAIEISREQYLKRLSAALAADVSWGTPVQAGLEVDSAPCYNRRSTPAPDNPHRIAP